MKDGGRTAIVRIRHRSYGKKVVRSQEVVNKFRLLEHIKYAFTISSLHGFNHIVWTGRSLFERLIWVCAVIGLAVFGIMNAYDVIQRYMDRPCVISVEMDYTHWRNEFPSFTMCPTILNTKYLMAHNITEDSDMYEYLNDLAFADYTTYKNYEKYANGSKKDLLAPEEYLKVLLEALPTLQNQSTGTNKISLFPFPDEERPIPPIITEFGICSTLNPSTGIYYTPEYLNSTAPYKHDPIYYGYKFTSLKFLLRNFDHPYKVALHSTNEVIDVTTKMDHYNILTITTYTVTTLSMWTPKIVQSLNVHQRNCKLFNETDGLDHSPVYTYNMCKKECRIKLCLKHCNCTPYYYRRNFGEKICDMAGMYCLSKYEKELVNLFDHTKNKSMCNCYESCFTNTIVVDNLDSIHWFSDTRMTIEILKYPELRYVRKLVFSKIDLLVQIGGILGLCLGCTILGIIEVLYFMTLRFYWGVIKGKSIKSSV